MLPEAPFRLAQDSPHLLIFVNFDGGIMSKVGLVSLVTIDKTMTALAIVPSDSTEETLGKHNHRFGVWAACKGVCSMVVSKSRFTLLIAVAVNRCAIPCLYPIIAPGLGAPGLPDTAVSRVQIEQLSLSCLKPSRRIYFYLFLFLCLPRDPLSQPRSRRWFECALVADCKEPTPSHAPQ